MLQANYRPLFLAHIKFRVCSDVLLGTHV